MKNISAILLLLFVLIALVGGQSLIFHIYRTKIRIEAKIITREMAEKDGVTLCFSKKEMSHMLPFEVIKKHEIYFDSEFYDLKSVRETKDSVIFTAFKDTDEKKLVASYSKKLRERDKKGCIQNIISQVVSWTYLLPDPNYAVVFAETKYIRFSNKCKSQGSVFLKTLSPPPEGCLYS